MNPTPQGTTATPAWTEADLASDPHARGDKAERVRQMFEAIARSYDLNNRVHSFGRDQAWRRRAVARARPVEGADVLDVACGTGDLAHCFARAGARSVIGVDFTHGMLDVAERKRRRLPTAAAQRVKYVRGDALALPFEDAAADIVSIAFGLRNVQDPARAVAEFRRVLRPGGRLVVLEFADPTAPGLRVLTNFYTRRVMPLTATLLGRDRSGAYRYLPKSVETFMSPDELRDLLLRSGFSDVADEPLTLGICRLYRAVRPERG